MGFQGNLNERITEWCGSERTSPPAMSRDILNYMKLLRAPSNQASKVSRDEACTTSLGNLFHHPHPKNLSLT